MRRTLTPSLSNYTFDPVSVVVIINGASITDTNFVATSTGGADTYSISGTITGAVQSDVKLTLSGGATGSVMTGSDGTYSFANVIGGTTYIVTPSLSGYTFNPENSEFTITSKDAANIDFTLSRSLPVPYTVTVPETVYVTVSSLLVQPLTIKNIMIRKYNKN